MATAASNSDQLFCVWFQSLNSGEKRRFLDKLLPIATPHKLFAQIERTLAGPRHIAASWEECRNFEEQALFCVSCVESWNPTRANYFVNALEGIDQEIVYEFYDKIASTIKEP